MADVELIIKIPDHLYKLLKDLPSDSNEGTIENVLMKAVESGTPIPDNATNDDVLKALFDERGYMGIHDRMIHTKWLSAPYQKGGEE